MVDFEDLISYIKMKFFKNVFLNYRESQHLKSHKNPFGKKFRYFKVEYSKLLVPCTVFKIN